MKYSFFGTCVNDYEQLFNCLETILEQTILPSEVILINSGEKNIKKLILEKLKNKKINLVYISKKKSRVESLNIAINYSTSDYSFRFDTRSRFSENYAENCLKFLIDKSFGAEVVGGVPEIIPQKKDFEAILCSQIMNRSYIFFYPKHRNINYSGYVSSVYLGCFKTNLLKQIKFNEKEALISEDSLIINDFLKKGYKAFISSSIKVSYVSRFSFINILKLFNNYGFCRAKTILISKNLFISSRHLLVFIFFVISLSLFLKFFHGLIFFYPLILLLVNYLGEFISFGRLAKIYIPFYATLCQFSWILGFLCGLISIFNKKNSNSNFIS